MVSLTQSIVLLVGGKISIRSLVVVGIYHRKTK